MIFYLSCFVVLLPCKDFVSKDYSVEIVTIVAVSVVLLFLFYLLRIFFILEFRFELL